MKCRECGFKNSKQAQFCKKCGKELKKHKKQMKVWQLIMLIVIPIVLIVGIVTMTVYYYPKTQGDADKNVSASEINLTINQEDFDSTKVRIALDGGFNENSNVIWITYEVYSEVDSGKVSRTGEATITNNKWEIKNIFLKEGENKIVVSAETSDNKVDSKTINVNFDIGKDYEYTESDIRKDEETGLRYVCNLIWVSVTYDITEDEENQLAKSVSGTIVGRKNDQRMIKIKVPEMTINELNSVCEKLEKSDKVDYASYYYADPPMPDISLNDPWGSGVFYNENFDERNPNGNNWWAEAIEAYSAWEYNDKFSHINIGIIDSGFDVGHEELKDKIKFPSEEYKKENNKEDHGTMVAGIIGAKENNKKGITGLVWNSDLYCADWEPSGKQNWNTSDKIYDAIQDMVKNHGVKVINLSLGFTGSLKIGETKFGDAWVNSQAQRAVKCMTDLLSQGYDFVIVQSSGNGTSGKNNFDDKKVQIDKQLAVDSINNGYFASVNKNNIVLPENSNITKEDILNRIIIVGAAEIADSKYRQTWWSNGGDGVDICAPGASIYSATFGIGPFELSGGYKKGDGTSLSAPMVTGTAALVWSVNPEFKGTQVKKIICEATDKEVLDNRDSRHLPNNEYKLLNTRLSVQEAIRRKEGFETVQTEFSLNVYDVNNNLCDDYYYYIKKIDDDGDFHLIGDRTAVSTRSSPKIKLEEGCYRLYLKGFTSHDIHNSYQDVQITFNVKNDSSANTSLDYNSSFVSNIIKNENAQSTRFTVLVLDPTGTYTIRTGGSIANIVTVGSPFSTVKKAAISFVEQTLRENSNNYIAIVACTKNETVSIDFTNDLSVLKKSIEGIKEIDSPGNYEFDFNKSLKLADEKLLKVSQDNIKQNIIVYSGWIPSYGDTSISGHYSSADYNYYVEATGIYHYAYSNSVFDTANKLKNKGYNIYSLGCFTNLNEQPESYAFAQRFMEDIQNKGYYNAEKPEDLIFFFNDVSEEINGQTYILVKIECPVDVTVSYNGEVLTSKEDSLNQRTDFGTLSFEGTENETKVLKLKSGIKYQIVINGTGEGEMNYSIKFPNTDGEYTDSRVFQNIPITPSTVVKTDTKTSNNTVLTVDKDGDGKNDIKYKSKANDVASIVEDYSPIYYLIGIAGIVLLISFIKKRKVKSI